MLFTIRLLQLKLNKDNFETIHKKIIESLDNALVHDCNTDQGFTMQLKSRDINIPGRVKIKADYDDSHTVVIAIEKEHQTEWSLKTMEELVKLFQDLDLTVTE